jgi:hypothetical protein
MPLICHSSHWNCVTTAKTSSIPPLKIERKSKIKRGVGVGELDFFPKGMLKCISSMRGDI